MPSASDTVVCPDCRTPSPMGVDRCPKCGYPLVLVQPPARSEEVDAELIVKPGDRTRDTSDADDTAVIAGGSLAAQPVAAIATSAAPGGLVCASCHQANAPERDRWCEWCGADMNPPVTQAVPQPVVSAPPPQRSRPVWLLWVVGAAVAAAVVLAVVLGPLTGGGTPTARSPVPSGSPSTPTVRESVLAPSGISAKASSTQQRPGYKGYYSIRNTLDGKENTAWNSDSDVVGTGVGVTLRYDFGRAVQLHAITVRNGYVTSRVPTVGTKVWRQNERLRQVLLKTDAGQVLWRLDDKPQPQTLYRPDDFGTTRTVTIVVKAVYPGSTYDDLALTDIAFTGVG